MSVGSVVQAGRVERELLAADGTGMAAVDDMRTSTAGSDVVSPELVLVDPDLAERARALLPELKEAVARRPRFGAEPPGEPDSHDTAPSSADDAFAVALRRISESALELEAPDPVRLPALRGRHRRGLLVALAAVAALAAFLVDRQVGPSGDPTTVPASAPDDRSARDDTSTSDAVSGERSQQRTGADAEEPRRGGTTTSNQAPGPRLGAGGGEEDRTPLATGADPGRSSEPNTPAPSAVPGARRVAPVWNPVGRRYEWASVAAASGYEVELYRGRARVFVTKTSRASVTIPRTWARGGRRLRPDPQDLLFVWPIVSGRRTPEPVVDGVLVVDVPLTAACVPCTR